MNRSIIVIAICIVAFALRITEVLPPNFSPVAAIALFGAAFMTRRTVGLLIPLAILILSDAFLGFHSAAPAVYAGFLLIGLIGLSMRSNPTMFKAIGGAIAGSVIFFLITNAAVWCTGTFYPPTSAGLIECYTAGLPFFRHTLVGNLVFTTALFGAFKLAMIKWPQLGKVKA